MNDVNECKNELASHGLVEHDNGDWVSLTDLIPHNVLLRYLARRPTPNREFAYSTATGESASMRLAALSSAPPPVSTDLVCGLWMPRSRTYCVLPNGHKGRCRSQASPKTSGKLAYIRCWLGLWGFRWGSGRLRSGWWRSRVALAPQLSISLELFRSGYGSDSPKVG